MGPAPAEGRECPFLLINTNRVTLEGCDERRVQMEVLARIVRFGVRRPDQVTACRQREASSLNRPAKGNQARRKFVAHVKVVPSAADMHSTVSAAAW